MRLSFKSNLEEFNETLEAYARHSRASAAEVVARKGADLGFRLWRKLRELAPKKGEVREERLAVMAATGGGIRVRPAAIKYAQAKTMATAINLKTRKDAIYFEKTRKGNVKTGALSFWQLAVKRELSYRESGRGYLGFSGHFRSMTQELKANRFDTTAEQKIRDRNFRFISAAGFRTDADQASLTFKWGGNNEASSGLARALQKPRARGKIGEALAEARADMLVYLKRKLEERGQTAAS